MARRSSNAAGQKDGTDSRSELDETRNPSVSPAGQIRRCGVKVHGGPWTIFAAPGRTSERRLIIALGRSAGGAVVRNRIRRVARDVFTKTHKELVGADFLLVARSEISKRPRRRVRMSLDGLFRRGHEALVRRQARSD
jgi:ribonuclease P protein component